MIAFVNLPLGKTENIYLAIEIVQEYLRKPASITSVLRGDIAFPFGNRVDIASRGLAVLNPYPVRHGERAIANACKFL